MTSKTDLPTRAVAEHPLGKNYLDRIDRALAFRAAVTDFVDRVKVTPVCYFSVLACIMYALL